MTQPLPLSPCAQAARRAIDIAGGGSALARLCNVTKGAVWQWKASGVPATRIPQVSRITGMSMAELRPDLFDPPQTGSDGQQVAA